MLGSKFIDLEFYGVRGSLAWLTVSEDCEVVNLLVWGWFHPSLVMFFLTLSRFSRMFFYVGVAPVHPRLCEALVYCLRHVSRIENSAWDCSALLGGSRT